MNTLLSTFPPDKALCLKKQLDTHVTHVITNVCEMQLNMEMVKGHELLLYFGRKG